MIRVGKSATVTVSTPKSTTDNITIDNNLSWCSINGNVITIAPPVGTTPGSYTLIVIFTRQVTSSITHTSELYYPITVAKQADSE